MKYRYILVAIWLAFTVALTSWWYIFSSRQLEEIKLVDHARSTELIRNQRMLVWEGATLIVSIFLGAGAILYFMFRELRESRRVGELFLTFSHELKTPLSALRLNSEAMIEDLSELPNELASPLKHTASRLAADVSRLNVRLENALSFASLENFTLFKEELELNSLIESLSAQWPELKVSLNENALVCADRRASEIIFSNLFQNALSHGSAKNVNIRAQAKSPSTVLISFDDDGQGADVSNGQLGEAFARVNSASGSGIGLFICKRLAQLSGGEIRFPQQTSTDKARGFRVEIQLPGKLLDKNVDESEYAKHIVG